jgi:ribonuclease HIII
MPKIKKNSVGTISINIDELDNLKGVILRDNLKRAALTNEYELLRIKDEDISIIVYKSGKLVHNNSEYTRIILKEIMETEESYDFILGSDETGKGEWYGPLVATCMALDPETLNDFRLMGVRDSKEIKKQQLMSLAEEIVELKPVYRSRILMPETYNRMQREFESEGENINELLAWAHSAAIKDVLDALEYDRARLVIDKFDVERTYDRLKGVDRCKVNIIQKSKGESEIPVAAASIIAKMAFERSVDELDKRYGLNLREQKPVNIDPRILPFVAKTHFRNVDQYIK